MKNLTVWVRIGVTLREGEAARIFTGGVVPESTYAIVPQVCG